MRRVSKKIVLPVSTTAVTLFGENISNYVFIAYFDLFTFLTSQPTLWNFFPDGTVYSTFTYTYDGKLQNEDLRIENHFW